MDQSPLNPSEKDPTRELSEAASGDETRVRLIVNSIDSIVWEYDLLTLRFTFVSQQAERLLGYPVSRWIDEPTFWQDHMHADDRDWATAFCAANTKNLRGHEFDYRMIAADGRVVWLKDIVSVITHNGQPVAIRGTMVDITEYKKAAEERDRLEQNREAFMSAAAHELRTPVSIIQGFAELMLHGGDAFPQRTRALKSIQKGAARLRSLINDLIDALRLQAAGNIQLQKKEFDLTPLLEDVVFRVGATSRRQTIANIQCFLSGPCRYRT